MGGMYTLKAAGTGRFDRAVAFYGMIRVPEHWQGAGHDRAARRRRGRRAPARRWPSSARVDPWTPPDDVAASRPPASTVVRYEGADHGFVHDASRPAHRADDAADAWRRAIAFLSQ